MGVNKTPDGRVNVGLGYSDLNQYKGYAGRREIVIQLTETGATQDSLDALEFLKSYAVYHNSVGEPIFPASTNVFISNNGVTKAVEADEVTVDGANVNIGGCVWNGTAWDFTNAGQGGGSSGGGVLVVNISQKTESKSGDTKGPVTALYVCDKTTGEMWSALTNGNGLLFYNETYSEFDTLKYAGVQDGVYGFVVVTGSSSMTFISDSLDAYPETAS